jgi:pyrroloquinoline quinone biosynthesis protein D
MPLDSIPSLAPHVRRQTDRVTGAAVLLHPEGILELSETADAVVSLCDGARNVAGIIAALAEEYEVEPEILRADVESCLESLAQRGLIVP